MDDRPGLRERKKAETRRAVYEATLRLTLEQGFDNVTVDAIARAANISRRTFSNYFAGKEDALLHGEQERNHALVATVRQRPAAEDAWSALRASVRALYELNGSPPNRELALRVRLAKRHPSVLARQLANQAAFARDLEAAVAGRRLPPGVRPAVLVAAFLAALRVALETWFDEEQDRSPVDMTEEVLDEVAAPFHRPAP